MTEFTGEKFVTGREGGDYYSGFYVDWLEERIAEGDRLLLAAALKYKGLEQRVERLEGRLDYAEDVLGNVGMDDTLDYLEETWPLAQEEA